MGSGKECIAWLTDEATPYPERVEFGLNVWQSVDYTNPNKYEVFIEWLAKSLPGNELPVAQLMRLFQLRAQPGMVSQDCKASLIQALLDNIDPAKCLDNTALKLLQSMFNFDLLQDVLRADFPLICRCYGTLFDCQQRCLKLRAEGHAGELQTDAEIVVAMIKQLAEIARRSQKVRMLRHCYDGLTVRPLVELILNLKSSCIEEMAGLEKQFEGQFCLQRISKQPLHVVLLLLECSVLNNRYNTATLSQLLRMVLEKKSDAGPQHSLILVAYLLETLRKYDVSLKFPLAKEQQTINEEDTNPRQSSEEESDAMDVTTETTTKPKAKPKPKKKKNGKQVSAFVYVSEQLLRLVKAHKQQHLRPVLMVLCSALRLNPLLLESSSYQITIWMMTAPKKTVEEEHLYSAYLVLLLDMFRRLSRSERFIMNLLKSLKDWLAKYQLPATGAPGKRKRETEPEPSTSEDLDDAEKHFISLIFADSGPAVSVSEPERQSSDEFKHLAHFWPSHTAGAAFSGLVGLLKAKPSIVIWKTLLHALVELLEDTPPTEILPANQEFARELIVAMLCQYLQGTRLTEHLHLYLEEVDEQMNRTAELLERFGRLLLSQEHSRRSMDAFLECLKWASSYEVLLFHYWTDAKPRTHTQRRRNFLPPDQWRLIQQRVFNFGKTACGQRLQRLEQQLVDSGWLAEEALADVVSKQQLHMLTRQQKQLRIQQKLSDIDRDTLMEDAECVELLCLQQLSDYAAAVRAANVKGSLLAKLKLEELPEEAHLVATIRKKAAPRKELQLPPADELIEFLQGHQHNELPGKIKSRLWLTLLALHHDLSRSEQQAQAMDVLEQLIDLMHFGQPLAICSHFPQLCELLSLVATSSATGWKFYETLFARCIRLHAAGSEAFLNSCSQYIKEELGGTKKLPADALRFLLLAIDTTAAATGPHAKHMQRLVQPLLELFGQIVAHKFRPSKKKETSDYKQFVDETIKSYGTYVSSCINRADKQKRATPTAEVAQEEEEPINEDFRRICKIYIGHSLNYKNPHALRLLNVAISHRQKLHFDPDEVEFVLSSYWKQLYADIAAGDIAALDVNCLELAFPLIIGYKTKEDLLVLLLTLTSEVQGLPSPLNPSQRIELQNVLTILSFIAKCSVSTIKGAMINKHFEIVSTNVAGRLKDNCHNSKSLALILLEAQRHLANNRTVPLTNESMEYLFGTMSVVAIDQFIERGGSWNDFSQLYAALTDTCVVLLRQHSNLVSDRAGQLSAVCETLIKAIVGYRSGRQRAQDLTESELDGLAELGLKLATVMASIGATQSLPLKRVAPFLLTFTINQMVETERPTTIFEKVKVNMERVCHELIGITDHRSGQFILRHNTTAGANMYTRLLKDHDKYHKFRGKV